MKKKKLQLPQQRIIRDYYEKLYVNKKENKEVIS